MRDGRGYARHGSGVWSGRGAVAAALVLAGAALALAGCSGGGEREEAPPPDAVYELQGVVERLPEAPDNSIYIRHEAIDEFTDSHGEVVGMDSMTMPFPVADGVSLDDIGPGDPVAFTFEVRWNAQPRYRLTAIRKLPVGTEIEFRRAEPPEE